MHSVKLLSPGPHVQAAKPQLALPTGHGSEAATLSRSRANPWLSLTPYLHPPVSPSL